MERKNKRKPDREGQEKGSPSEQQEPRLGGRRDKKVFRSLQVQGALRGRQRRG